MSNLLLPGIVVIAACILSVLLNVFALIVFLKRRRLRRRAHLIPLFHLTVVDLLAVVTWSAPSIAIAVADWSTLPDGLCHAHAYFRSLWNMLHVHTLATLAIERAVRLVKPSRHVIIFQPRVVAILLLGVWVFDVVVASIPHYDYLEFQLVADEMQCSADFTTSVATLNFDLCIKWVLPYLLVMVPCFALAAGKVWLRRRQALAGGEIGEIVLESSPYSTSYAYTERLEDFHRRFKDVGTKSAKPKLGDKTFTSQGYVTDSDSDVNDVTAAELRAPRKVCFLARREYVLLKTYALLSFVYLLLWLPLVAVTMVRNHDPFTSVSDWLITLAAVLTHFPQFVLPAVYLSFNSSFRRSAVKTLRGAGRKQVKATPELT